MKRKMELPHPGEILREEVIRERGLEVKQAAEMLGVTRQALSRVLNEKAGISADMAARIGVVFKGSDELWMRLQMNYDLDKARQRVRELNLKPYTKRSRPQGAE